MGDETDTPAEMPTHELMSWLDDAQRDRYVKFQELFECDGWRLLTEYATAKVVQHGIDGSNASTWEKVLENRGARQAWDQVSKLADEFMGAFEQMAIGNKHDASMAEESLE